MSQNNVYTVVARNNILISLPRHIWQQFDLFRNAPSAVSHLKIDVDVRVVRHCASVLAAQGNMNHQWSISETFYDVTKDCVIETLRQLDYLQCDSVKLLYCACLLRHASRIDSRREMQKLYNIRPRCADANTDLEYRETNSDFCLLAALV